jgi:hypothetical protein
MNVYSNTVGGTMVSVSDGIKYQGSVWTLASIEQIVVTANCYVEGIVSRDSISISNLNDLTRILKESTRW